MVSILTYMSSVKPAAAACWWCGGVPDSSEHRFKASQLKRMFVGNDHLILDKGEYPARLNGPGAKPVLFPWLMCKQCNNARSQPFDKAYDEFVQLVWDDPERFRNITHIDMDGVFPADSAAAKNLCRYYIKNIACRIAEIGFEVPPEMVDFLNGASGMPNAVIVLYRDFSNYDQFERCGVGGHYQYANRAHNPENLSDGPLEEFVAEIQDGPIGAMFWWSRAGVERSIDFCSQRLVPLRERRDLPNHELHQEEWDRADLMRRAQDQLAGQPGSE